MRPEDIKIDIRVIPIKLELKKEFTVSKGSALNKDSFILSFDRVAYGEASGSVHYGPSTDQVLNDLNRFTADYAGNISDLYDLENLNNIDYNRVAKTAVVNGMINYISYREEKYPWEILKLDPPRNITTSFTVSIDQPESMIEQIKNSPYPIIKIKMGTENDEILIDMLRKIDGKIFRVDANGGWDPETAERICFFLGQMNAEIIEQPTDIEYIEEWSYIKNRARCKAPFMLDEGLYTVEDYLKYSDYIDGINIKMAKSGGIIEAVGIARAARKDKRKIMLGCMIESSIAIAPSVYMSSLADYFDLDGPLLIKYDPGIGLDYDMAGLSPGGDIIGGPKLKDEFISNE